MSFPTLKEIERERDSAKESLIRDVKEEIAVRKIPADDAGVLFQCAEGISANFDQMFGQLERVARVLEKYPRPERLHP